MSNPIVPTVGRVVYFIPAGCSIIPDYQTGVCAALVTAIHNENCVNLAVFDVNGQHHARCSVCHVSTLPEIPEGGVQKYDYWDWMPYQKGQAAKTEQLEQKLVSGSVGCDPEVVISDASFAVPVPSKSNAQIKMDFGDAIEALKQGHAVARQLWNGMWIALGEGNPILEADKFWNPHSKQHALNQGGTAAVAPYIIFKNYQDEIQMGWQPSQADVLSVDWIIVD